MSNTALFIVMFAFGFVVGILAMILFILKVAKTVVKFILDLMSNEDVKNKLGSMKKDKKDEKKTVDEPEMPVGEVTNMQEKLNRYPANYYEWLRNNTRNEDMSVTCDTDGDTAANAVKETCTWVDPIKDDAIVEDKENDND